MQMIRSTIRNIDRLNDFVGAAAGWVSLIMVLVVVVDVVMRYTFNITFVFVQELEWHLFGILFLAGAGYTLRHDGHVRVDIFYQRLSPKGRAIINLAGVFFFLLPGCYLVIRTGYHFFSTSLSMNEGSPDPGGIPARYVLKFFIPFGFTMVAVQGISMALKNLLILMGETYEEEEAPL